MFEIFISHRQEDRAVAELFKGTLENLAENAIKCWVCEDTPGAADWYKWIGAKLQTSQLLVFLHTTVDHDWTWCALEIGQFQGAKQAQKIEPSIVWFSLEDLDIPPILANFQKYGTSPEDIRKFLRELFTEGTFSQGEAIRQDIHLRRHKDFQDAIQNISAIFAQISRPEELFKLRIRVVLGAQGDFTKHMEILSKLPIAERVTKVFENAIVHTDQGTKAFLAGNTDGDLNWKALDESQRQLQNHAWIEDLVNYIRASYSDSKALDRRGREQVLSPIYRDMRLFQPVIARLEYIRSWPHSAVVIFVPMPPFSEDPHLMIAQGIPSPIVYNSVMARLVRRFRWTFIEPLAQAADMLDRAEMNSRLWKNFVEKFNECQQTLVSLEHQYRSIFEFRALGTAINAMDLRERATYDSLFLSYDQMKINLITAVETGDAETVQSILAEWQKGTKLLMLQLVERIHDELQKLQPSDPGVPV
jgi:TIR domain